MRIVLVEPSRTVRRIIIGFAQQWGYRISAFSDGPEALSHIERDHAVHALITSAILPTMSGEDLCLLARKRFERPLYIIVMSSNHEYTKCVQALDHGADEFITKPLMMEELRARLRTADRVTKMQCELVQLAKTDSLTNLPNRRAFFEDAVQAIEHAQNGLPLAAIMFDLDHFKRINDMHGHEIGDVALKSVATEIKAIPSTSGRLGGEEFALLLQINCQDALEIAEELRHCVEQIKVFDGDQRVPLTCSLGLAEWEVGDNIDTLLRRADIALYEAKRAGRNQVICADTFIQTRVHAAWRGKARGKNRDFRGHNEPLLRTSNARLR